MDIRVFWPEITNEDIDTLRALSPYEWLIARRLYNGERIGGREISEDDLIQALPKEKLREAKKAVKTLEKKRIIVKKPKPTTIIYQTRHDFFTSTPVVTFIKKITENEMLRKTLINESLEFTKVSEPLMAIVNHALTSKRNIHEKKIAASERIAYDGNRGLRIYIKAQCPKEGFFEIEYDVVDPRDMSQLTFEIRCSCCSFHTCNAYGRVLSTYQ